MTNELFREAMGKFATGITVVTTNTHDETVGMTVNAFMSISLDPKLIAISIDKKASMYNILQETKKFGISVLSEDQKDLSMIFARQKEENKEINYDYVDGLPVLKDSLVTLACEVQSSVVAGDHRIFIAEVSNINQKDGEPILYFGGQYRQIEKSN